jgi:hypothetical protein
MIDPLRLEAELREVWMTVVAIATSLDRLGYYAQTVGDDGGREALWDYFTIDPRPFTRLNDADVRLHRLLTIINPKNIEFLYALRNDEQAMEFWKGPYRDDAT